jgi:hypothetical protein
MKNMITTIGISTEFLIWGSSTKSTGMIKQYYLQFIHVWLWRADLGQKGKLVFFCLFELPAPPEQHSQSLAKVIFTASYPWIGKREHTSNY